MLNVGPQMHSNVGYIATLALNLSLLLPLMNNPKVDNYTLVLYVQSNSGRGRYIHANIGPMDIG